MWKLLLIVAVAYLVGSAYPGPGVQLLGKVGL